MKGRVKQTQDLYLGDLCLSSVVLTYTCDKVMSPNVTEVIEVTKLFKPKA